MDPLAGRNARVLPVGRVPLDDGPASPDIVGRPVCVNPRLVPL
jgi:hypothetical protein